MYLANGTQPHHEGYIMLKIVVKNKSWFCPRGDENIITLSDDTGSKSHHRQTIY
jgi:hypothetical protein